MTVEIRPARWSDRTAIADLMDAMGGHDGAHERPGTWPNLALTLRLPRVRVLVAERDGEVVGWIEVQRRPSPIMGVTQAWIASLCVAEDARGQRIGHELIERAAREAVLLGADELCVDTATYREDTHRFYRANGFADDAPARRLRRPVRADGEADLATRFLEAAGTAAHAAAGALACLDGEADPPAADGSDAGRATPARAVPEAMTADAMGAAHARPARAAPDAAAAAAAIPAFEPLGLPILTTGRDPAGGPPEPDDPWIALTPLDGADNQRVGLPPWALATALVVDERPVAAWVSDLAGGRSWSAVAGGGARADGRAIRVRDTGLRLGVHRIIGSAAIGLCHVADGAACACVDDCTIGSLAAGHLLVAEAGGVVRAPRPTFDVHGRRRVVAACSPQHLDGH